MYTMSYLRKLCQLLVTKGHHSLLKNSIGPKHSRIFGLNNQNLSQTHFSSSSSSEEKFKKRTYSLVIFDKDGTIIEFGSGWTEWAERLSRTMEADTGLHLGNKLLELFGYDCTEKRWREGLMCDNPATILTTISLFLQSEGLSKQEADDTIHRTFRDDHTSDPSHIKPIDNPLAIFKTLRHYKKKTVLCTSDSIYSTRQTIEKLELERYSDLTFCGDSEHFVAKPAPDNILRICDEMNVPLKETVMIGDSRRDMEMGRAAGVGLNIGVTSGVCDKHELSPDADIVLDHIGQAMTFVLPDGWQDVYRKFIIYKYI